MEHVICHLESIQHNFMAIREDEIVEELDSGKDASYVFLMCVTEVSSCFMQAMPLHSFLTVKPLE